MTVGAIGVAIALLGLVAEYVQALQVVQNYLRERRQASARPGIMISPTLLDAEPTTVPGVGSVVRVGMSLHNASEPEAELHNVVGELWTEGERLFEVQREPGSVYRERRENGRHHGAFAFALLPKTGLVRFPIWVFRLPTPEQAILFGAQITSTEIDKEQYLWKLVNKGGRPDIIWVESPRPVQ